MGFLPSCSHFGTTVWLHHLDSNEMLEEKPRRKLHKNVTYCFEPKSCCVATYLQSHNPSKKNIENMLSNAVEIRANS